MNQRMSLRKKRKMMIENIIIVIIAAPLSILFLWKLLENGVDPTYNEWLATKNEIKEE